MFEDVKLTWAGADYTVPAEKVMRLVGRVEAELTRDYPEENAFQLLSRPSGPPLAALSAAYASALSFAGADVKPQEVYMALWQGEQNTAEIATLATMGLLEIMLPPDTFKADEGSSDGGKSEAS